MTSGFLQGKGFTVEIYYLEEPCSSYLQAAVDTVLSIHDKVHDYLSYTNMMVELFYLHLFWLNVAYSIPGN